MSKEPLGDCTQGPAPTDAGSTSFPTLLAAIAGFRSRSRALLCKGVSDKKTPKFKQSIPDSCFAALKGSQPTAKHLPVSHSPSIPLQKTRSCDMAFKTDQLGSRPQGWYQKSKEYLNQIPRFKRTSNTMVCVHPMRPHSSSSVSAQSGAKIESDPTSLLASCGIRGVT